MKLLKTILLFTVTLITFTTANAQKPGLNFAVKLVYKDYLEVKNALATNNALLAQNKAGKMVWDLNTVPTKDMTSEQHAAWFETLARIQSTARQISESNSLSYQRKYLSALSNYLYNGLKSMKLNTFVVYRQYSAGTDSYWLNDSPTIKNPYNGSKEGVTREVLQATTK
jgi:hypothetical protein